MLIFGRPGRSNLREKCLLKYELKDEQDLNKWKKISSNSGVPGGKMRTTNPVKSQFDRKSN